MRALWDWAVTTPGASWTLPALGALIGALVGAWIAGVRGRRALRRRFVRFYESAHDDVSDAVLGSELSLRGVLVADEGASVPAWGDGRAVVLACAVLDGEGGALLAHERARGLAVRTRSGAIVPLVGAVRVAWGARERAPMRGSRLPAALRDRLGALVDELESARIALRAIPAGAEVIVEGVLQPRGPEGSSYREGASAPVLAPGSSGTIDVIASRPAPRAATLRTGALALAPVVALVAALAPSLADRGRQSGGFEPDVRDVAMMSTPLWRDEARARARVLREDALDAEGLRAQLLLEEALGGCAHAAESALARGAVDDALAIAERCHDERVRRQRVIALRAQGRFADALAAMELSWLGPRDRARLRAEAGDVEGALRELEGSRDLRCIALAVRASHADADVRQELYGRATEAICREGLALLQLHEQGSTDLALRVDRREISAILALRGVDEPVVRERFTWRGARVTELALDPPRRCDAFCRRAAERVLAGEGTVALAWLARPALDRAITAGDVAALDRLAAALEPFDAREVARARAATAVLWRPDGAPAAIAALERVARADEGAWARALLAASRGEIDAILELPSHQVCDHFGCDAAPWVAARWDAAAAGDARGVARSLPRMRGVLLATSRLDAQGGAELADRMRCTRRPVSMDTPLGALHAELLVHRGVARAIGDDAWAAQLDERIARFDALFDRDDLALLLHLLVRYD